MTGLIIIGLGVIVAGAAVLLWSAYDTETCPCGVVLRPGQTCPSCNWTYDPEDEQ